MKISVTAITDDVKKGMTRAELMNKYDLKPNTLKVILKKLSLNPKKSRKPKFELVYDNEEVGTSIN